MQFSKELTYKEMLERLNELQKRSQGVSVTYIGQSVFERGIPLVTLGDKSAQKSVLYVATHNATDNICSSVLVNFIEEYLNAYERYAQMYQINLRYLYKMRKIYIVPMLNPDGVEYRLNGVGEDNPIKERLLAQNGNEDFSKWSANGRGIDLNCNYNVKSEGCKILRCDGEYTQSEPEIIALTNFIKYNQTEIEGVLSFHTSGEKICYRSKDATPKRAEHIARLISRSTGYDLTEAKGEGLGNWFIQECQRPALTVKCGIGESPLPANQIMPIYARLKETLFTFPILF